jgi:hypothetical protein
VKIVATLSRRNVVGEYLVEHAIAKTGSTEDAKAIAAGRAADLWLSMTPDEQDEAEWLVNE